MVEMSNEMRKNLFFIIAPTKEKTNRPAIFVRNNTGNEIDSIESGL